MLLLMCWRGHFSLVYFVDAGGMFVLMVLLIQPSYIKSCWFLLVQFVVKPRGVLCIEFDRIWWVVLVRSSHLGGS